jgi:uncharacterized protein
MAQVSFPGVYVNEIPSGSHTITGVATSIPAFVGMTKGGPINVPTTVLGFTDFARTFLADISQGELPDQVRQFFLNGGTTAIIVRIAHGAASSSVTLQSAAGTSVLTLTSISAGSAQNALRVTVDYDTPTPEKTFNLTIFQETLDSAGNATDSNQETIPNVSLDPNDPRFVVRTVGNESALVTATLPSTPTAGTGFSISGTGSADFIGLINSTLTTLGGAGTFRLTVETGSTQVVTLQAPVTLASLQTSIAAAVSLSLSGAASQTILLASSGATQFLQISVAGLDVSLDTGPSADIAGPLGLGTAQGGLEIGSYATFRPAPSALVSVPGDLTTATDPVANLMAFVDATKTWTGTTLTLTGSAPFAMDAGSVAFAVATGTMKEGNAVPGQPAAFSLLNVAQNLQAIASAINVVTTQWHAELQGYRLALIPTFGDSQSGPGNAFPTTGQPPGFGAFITGAVSATAAFQLAGGNDGSKPGPAEYNAAYAIIDSQVDIFNLLVLPKSAADTANDRAALWGPASAFCVQRLAFLLMDLSSDVNTVDAAVTAVKQSRIGIAKDHAATYWPRLSVNPDGTPRNIDPSGTIAGIMARIDGTRGVWKAPAGLEADLRGILGVTTKMSDAENGRLNPEALNAIRVFPNGIVSWGARTMDGFDNSGDDDFKYIPVRRFELFIEESLIDGLRFAVFEPNAEPLWSTIRLSVNAFMNNLFRQGAFAGTTTLNSFFVKVDSETTTPTDVNLGIVNVLVGFAPLKPAEFVVITIQQQAGQVQV